MENSKKYAEYLFSGRQYKLAAEEYERLVFFDSSNIIFKLRLVKSYRLTGDLRSGITQINSFYGINMPEPMAIEFVKLQLLSDSLKVVNDFLSLNNTISPESKVIYQSCDLLLSGDYKGADMLVKTSVVRNPSFPKNLISLSESAARTKFKSPFIAAGFSSIIPGTGKFYTKNWADGIFSILFVAGNAWQSYRGFKEHGIKSAYGWAFGTLSASFYIGNIFGSAKAARRYNLLRKNEIKNKTFEIVRSDNF
ncbi:MAG TPA: hypothetical protein VIK07_01670 [Bacteroidales bacterium]